MTILQDVSRETISNLEEYETLIRKWSPSVNLIAKSTLSDIWSRHIIDSTKLFSFIPNTCNQITDIGSGGGMPGLVIAIIAKELRPGVEVTLIESDQRKAAFLRAVSIQLELNTSIITDRIEDATPTLADLVTARALAPMPKLLEYVRRHISDSGKALLLKGRSHAEEVALARKTWDFDLEIIPNQDDANSVILMLSKLRDKRSNES